MTLAAPESVGGPAALEQQIDGFMMRVAAQSPGETEFHQAVHEVVKSVMPLVQSKRPIARPRSWIAWWCRRA